MYSVEQQKETDRTQKTATDIRHAQPIEHREHEQSAHDIVRKFYQASFQSAFIFFAFDFLFRVLRAKDIGVMQMTRENMKEE
jgi:hypothetical protein